VPVYVVKLVRLLNSLRSVRQHDAHHIEALGQELEKAIIVDKTEVPRDVVTMSSPRACARSKDPRGLRVVPSLPAGCKRREEPGQFWRLSVMHGSVIGPATLSSGKFLPEPAGCVSLR